MLLWPLIQAEEAAAWNGTRPSFRWHESLTSIGPLRGPQGPSGATSTSPFSLCRTGQWAWWPCWGPLMSILSFPDSMADMISWSVQCDNWSVKKKNLIWHFGLISCETRIMITMNMTLIGLNWTVLLKCLEKTFVVIWRFINKTELTSMAQWNQQITLMMVISDRYLLLKGWLVTTGVFYIPSGTPSHILVDKKRSDGVWKQLVEHLYDRYKADSGSKVIQRLTNTTCMRHKWEKESDSSIPEELAKSTDFLSLVIN